MNISRFVYIIEYWEKIEGVTMFLEYQKGGVFVEIRYKNDVVSYDGAPCQEAIVKLKKGLDELLKANYS